jgi:hypothetical protein
MVAIAALMIYGKSLRGVAIVLLSAIDSTIGLGLHSWDVEPKNIIVVAKVDQSVIS